MSSKVIITIQFNNKILGYHFCGLSPPLLVSPLADDATATAAATLCNLSKTFVQKRLP